MLDWVRRDKQVPGVNRENEADQFACSVQAEFWTGRDSARISFHHNCRVG